MKNWTVDYSLEEKLEILEKEWIPIVIERSSKKSEAEEKISFWEKHGFLTATQQEIIESKTFEDYLNERPLILFSKRTAQSTCHPLIQGF